MPSQSDSEHYKVLCQRVDAFIATALLRGTFQASRAETERIYLALAATFPDEHDAIATFWDRITAQRFATVEDVGTGEDLLVNIKLAPGIYSGVPQDVR